MQTAVRALIPGLLLAVSFSTGTEAAPCLQDAFGAPVECTASDVSIVTVSDMQVGDFCEFEGDVLSFDATFEIAAQSQKRYDVGLYVGVDGQALTGTCTVAVLPTGPAPFTSLDGDSCGDVDGPANLLVRITNVVAECRDIDGDGFFDVAACASWAQSASSVCNGPDDAVPGSASKCGCSILDLGLELPSCDTNADCPPDGIPCSDEICDYGDPRQDPFGCVSVPNSANCEDGNFCNGEEVCDGALGCIAGTPPSCDDEVECTVDSCSVQQDSCVHDDGSCPGSTTTLPPTTTTIATTTTTIATTTTSIATTTTTLEPVCGDANGDGNVTAGDAQSILRASVGSGGCTLQPCACDADSSGSVTAGDALAVLRKSVGLPVVLACSCGS